MHGVAIRAEGLCKEYYIGGHQQTHETLGSQLADLVFAPVRRAGKLMRGQATGAAELDQTFWALQDLNFQIDHGEVVGIIGRNGAGKSTLLKILSRITEPTRGRAEIHGRVSSLLEVGTGFHPELTGRENIFLNGSILGMRRVEIERKFDEIVAFAEIEEFIDTPVKHYSSGMYVRLAFAVAAHLEPEVLLVDEVLAVGDVAFQRKCLGKMNDVARQGRTVLFVSHNMGIMQTLCQRGIFLHGGRLQVDSTINEAIDAYLQTLAQASLQDVAQRTDRKGQGKVQLVGIDVADRHSGAATLKTGYPARFIFHLSANIPGIQCNFAIYDHLGQAVVGFSSADTAPQDTIGEAGEQKFICDFDELLLLPGRYHVNVSLVGDNVLQDFVEAVTVLEVGAGHLRGRAAKPSKSFRMWMPHSWTLPARQ